MIAVLGETDGVDRHVVVVPLQRLEEFLEVCGKIVSVALRRLAVGEEDDGGVLDGRRVQVDGGRLLDLLERVDDGLKRVREVRSAPGAEKIDFLEKVFEAAAFGASHDGCGGRVVDDAGLDHWICVAHGEDVFCGGDDLAAGIAGHGPTLIVDENAKSRRWLCLDGDLGASDLKLSDEFAVVNVVMVVDGDDFGVPSVRCWR